MLSKGRFEKNEKKNDSSKILRMGFARNLP
jgi:hypothetical protein